MIAHEKEKKFNDSAPLVVLIILFILTQKDADFPAWCLRHKQVIVGFLGEDAHKPNAPKLCLFF